MLHSQPELIGRGPGIGSSCAEANMTRECSKETLGDAVIRTKISYDASQTLPSHVHVFLALLPLTHANV
jgi:hypothetical protein